MKSIDLKSGVVYQTTGGHTRKIIRFDGSDVIYRDSGQKAMRMNRAVFADMVSQPINGVKK